MFSVAILWDWRNYPEKYTEKLSSFFARIWNSLSFTNSTCRRRMHEKQSIAINKNKRSKWRKSRYKWLEFTWIIFQILKHIIVKLLKRIELIKICFRPSYLNSNFALTPIASYLKTYFKHLGPAYHISALLVNFY